MLLALWLAARGVVHVPQTDGPDRLAWIVVLLVQSTPYAAAVLVSVASALPLPARWLGTGVVRCEGEDAARVTAAR